MLIREVIFTEHQSIGNASRDLEDDELSQSGGDAEFDTASRIRAD